MAEGMSSTNMNAWLDEVLNTRFHDEVVAIAFNLYEESDNKWALEVIGASSFDPDDSDWACDEITDFGTRDNPFIWKDDSSWEKVLDEVKLTLTEYLKQGKNADSLNN